MSWLNYSFYDNTVGAWLSALGAAVFVLIGLRFLLGFTIRRIATFAGTTETRLDDVVLNVIKHTKFLFLLIVGVFVASELLTLPESMHDIIESIVVIAFLIQVGLWANCLVTEWVTSQSGGDDDNRGRRATTVGVIAAPLRILVWSFALLIALDNLGIDITALIAGLGVGGIAIALATQSILGDLFASLSIVLDRPFEIGDFVIVGGDMGTVERIGLKTTRVRALSGEIIVFSNSDLLGSRIQNYKQMQQRRVVFDIGVTYQTPADQVAAIPDMVREIIEAQEHTRYDRGHFQSFGPSSLDFQFVFTMLVPDFAAKADAQHAINLAILRRFEAEGIEFAYPTQTLFVERGESEPGVGST